MPRYPSNAQELIKLLTNLGFEYDTGGKHAYKFIHSERHAKSGKRDFITLNIHNVDENFSEQVIKKK